MNITGVAYATSQRPQGFLDNLGMGASTLCVAHCVLTPVILFALPLAGLAFLENELVDRSLAVLAIFICIMAVSSGYRIHGNRKLMLLAIFGVACLLVAAFVAEHFWGETGDQVFTMIGGTALALTHWFNRSFCRACTSCREDESSCSMGRGR